MKAKPCKRCGHEPLIDKCDCWGADECSYSIGCSNYDCEDLNLTVYADTEEEVIRVWNKANE